MLAARPTADSLVALALTFASVAFITRSIEASAAFHVASYLTIHVFVCGYMRLAGLAWQAAPYRAVVFDRTSVLRLLRRLVADFGIGVWSSLGVMLAAFSRLLRHNRKSKGGKKWPTRGQRIG